MREKTVEERCNSLIKDIDDGIKESETKYNEYLNKGDYIKANFYLTSINQYLMLKINVIETMNL